MPTIARLIASASCYQCRGTGIAIKREVQTPTGIVAGSWDRIQFRVAVCMCVDMRPQRLKQRKQETPDAV